MLDLSIQLTCQPDGTISKSFELISCIHLVKIPQKAAGEAKTSVYYIPADQSDWLLQVYQGAKADCRLQLFCGFSEKLGAVVSHPHLSSLSVKEADW